MALDRAALVRSFGAWACYLAMGFVADAVFHRVPLVLAFAGLSALLGSRLACYALWRLARGELRHRWLARA